MNSCDIAIAGCGIGGLAAALALHAQGHQVTLYERFDEPQPLGSGLMIQPSGLAVLDALGLGRPIVASGAPVRGLLGLNTEGEAVLEADYACLPYASSFGLGIHRASLFGSLYEAVQRAGIAIRTGFAVRQVVSQSSGIVLVSQGNEHSPTHDLVIDALGLHSTLVPQVESYLPYGALWATVDWPEGAGFDPGLLEQRYERSLRMVGLLPVGLGKAAFFWSLKADEIDHWRARGLESWWDEVCTLWPQCAVLRPQIASTEQLVFARYAHRSSPSGTNPRLLHIGDAWHAASPQLGQGANMALLDAWAVARALSTADAMQDLQPHFLKMRARHVRLYQWLTWAFTSPFQSDAAWPAMLRDLLLAPASRIPPGPQMKAQLVAGLAGNPLAKLGLSLPDFPALRRAVPAAPLP